MTIALDEITFRPAQRSEARMLAAFYSTSSDGVADYIWSKVAEPGEGILDVGTRRYERENTVFSYENCIVANYKGVVVGMMGGFPMHVDPDEEPESDPVLAPYAKLEVDGSFYIAGIVVDSDYRSMGLGTALLDQAIERARQSGLDQLSAIVVEQKPSL